MAMRVAPIKDPSTLAEDATITETQVLDSSAHAPAHRSTAASSALGLSQKAQAMRQHCNDNALNSHHAAEPATAVADAAAVDHGKKRKAEAEALQLAQAATAVVITAGKRRASPEAEVGLRNIPEAVQQCTAQPQALCSWLP